MLQAMDWKVFEDLCGEVLTGAGFEKIASDPVVTGGDFEMVALSAGGTASRHDVAVRCRRWTMPVGIQPVRAFLSAVRRRGMPHGIFVTAGSFARRVRIEFAHEPELALVDGRELVEGITDLGPAVAGSLLERFVGEGEEWRMPTCPSCGIKMELEEGVPDSLQEGLGGSSYVCPNRERRLHPCETRYSLQGFPMDERGGSAGLGRSEPRRRFTLRHLRDSEELVLPS